MTLEEKIKSLDDQCNTLAVLVVELRGALEEAIKSAHPHPVEHPTMTAAWAVMRAALSLPLPAAAERVKEWREKAERLDDWANKWEDYVAAPNHSDDKERLLFLEAEFKLRHYAQQLRAARGAE